MGIVPRLRQGRLGLHPQVGGRSIRRTVGREEDGLPALLEIDENFHDLVTALRRRPSARRDDRGRREDRSGIEVQASDIGVETLVHCG